MKQRMELNPSWSRECTVVEVPSKPRAALCTDCPDLPHRQHCKAFYNTFMVHRWLIP